jgi:hypothetical protein
MTYLNNVRKVGRLVLSRTSCVFFAIRIEAVSICNHEVFYVKPFEAEERKRDRKDSKRVEAKRKWERSERHFISGGRNSII